MGRIRIAEGITLDESAVDVRFVRSGGPGGQKVNTSATTVQLFLNIFEAGFPEDMLRRLRQREASRIGSDGRLMVECSTHRSQGRNRKLAMKRLVRLLRQAARKPRKRKRTGPPRAAKEKRLRKKKMQSRKKKLRRRPDPSDY